MAFSRYKVLRQQDLDEEKVSSSSPFLSRAASIWLVVLLFPSLLLNTVWVYQRLHTSSENVGENPTFYAGLVRDMAVPFTVDTIYTSSNRTIEDEAWNSPSLLPDTGLVALSDDWVHSKNLPKAQRFPWDESKGVYLLNGFHNMHCLHILRKSILEAFDGHLKLPREHVAHCLDVLRGVIMCDADDTPRYTGRINQQAFAEHPTSGVGQTRMCRDWSQLEKWAVEHSACYKAFNFNDPEFPPIERYKFCPNGEKLWP